MIIHHMARWLEMARDTELRVYSVDDRGSGLKYCIHAQMLSYEWLKLSCLMLLSGKPLVTNITCFKENF